MTYKQLNNLIYVKKEIEQDRKRIRELRERATSRTGSGFGMWGPHAGVTDRVGCCVAAMVDLERRVDANLWRLYKKEAEARAYIDSLVDPRIRTILKLRFIEGLSWRSVAQRMGGGETEASVKMGASREIKKSAERS